MTSPHVFDELAASAINPAIALFNFKIVASGNEGYEYLLYSDKLERLNTGRLSSKWLKRYKHLENGGLVCNGLDPFNKWREMLWCCLKPNTPKRDLDGKKLIKYEHPPKEETRAFFLRVPPSIREQIAQRYGIPSGINPELPLDMQFEQFWEWVICNSHKIPVIICEGAKKAAALLSAGYAAVAIPGIFQGFRTPKDKDGNRQLKARHLIPEIELITRGGREVYICFDQDQKQKTITNVNQAIATFAKLLEEAGSTVKVINWDNKLGKGVDDLIFNHGVEVFDEAYNRALTAYHYQRKATAALTYPVALTVDRRYLGNISIPESEKLVCFKAPKGSGKTETIAQLVGDAIQTGQAVLVLTHRVQLGEALCNRFGVPYVTQISDSETGKLFGYGLCVDSLHPNSQARFNASGWDDALVIIDECEQVFWHLLSASTEVAKHRVSILRQFKELIVNTITGGGRIILSDADLSDVSIDYIRGLSGVDLQPWILNNEYKPKDGGWTVYSYNDKNPARIVDGIEKAIADGQKLLILCSGQKITSKWGTQILEMRFKQKFPNAKILRVDSETISDLSHPAFGCVLHANETFKSFDIIIASPSIETGVSIDITDHFNSVWGIAQGNLAETSVRQQLARLRTDVDRHIWAASYGGKLIGNGATYSSALLTSQDRLYKAHIRLLKDTDFNSELIDESFDMVSLRTWAKMAARINAGKIKYRESILDGLASEGHTVIEMEPDTDPEGSKELSEELSELRDCCHLDEADLEAAVELVTPAEYEKLASKKAKTKEERLKERKYSRHLKYGVDVTQSLILKDDDGWHPQIQLHYYCTVGREHLKARDRKRTDAQLQLAEGALWKPDFNRSQLSVKVHSLETLGVLKLLSPKREYRRTDEDLIEFAENCKLYKKNIKEGLGVTIRDTDTPIAILQNLLKKVGLKLTYLKREGSNGDRVRVYGYTPPDDGREVIYAFWLERDITSTPGNSDQLTYGRDVA
ncbi:MAG TPA: plasmid replication protein, CyRepA1 family [Oculatellaceae cyanobacterium]